MTVTAEQLASVRAYVTGDTNEFKRITDAFDATEGRVNGALISAAFYLAASKRFAVADPKSEIISFVSDLRSTSAEEVADAINPHIAERLLLTTVADEDIDDIDDEVRGKLISLLLVAMVKEANFEGSELDGFLVEAGRLAEKWLGNS